MTTINIDLQEVATTAFKEILEEYPLDCLVYDIAIANPQWWSDTFKPVIDESIKQAFMKKGEKILKEIMESVISESDLDYLIERKVEEIVTPIVKEQIMKGFKNAKGI